MVLFLIIGICVGALAVDFAMQNTAPVTVALFPWQFTAPLSLLLLCAVAVGLVMAVLALIPGLITRELDAYAQRRELKRLAASGTYHVAQSDQQIVA